MLANKTEKGSFDFATLLSYVTRMTGGLDRLHDFLSQERVKYWNESLPIIKGVVHLILSGRRYFNFTHGSLKLDLGNETRFSVHSLMACHTFSTCPAHVYVVSIDVTNTYLDMCIGWTPAMTYIDHITSMSCTGTLGRC